MTLSLFLDCVIMLLSKKYEGYIWANDIECSDTLHNDSVHNVCEKTDVQNL